MSPETPVSLLDVPRDLDDIPGDILDMFSHDVSVSFINNIPSSLLCEEELSF